MKEWNPNVSEGTIPFSVSDIEENILVIKVYDLQGTYLQWMDFNGLGLDKDQLEKLMHESELFFDE